MPIASSLDKSRLVKLKIHLCTKNDGKVEQKREVLT